MDRGAVRDIRSVNLDSNADTRRHPHRDPVSS